MFCFSLNGQNVWISSQDIVLIVSPYQLSEVLFPSSGVKLNCDFRLDLFQYFLIIYVPFRLRSMLYLPSANWNVMSYFYIGSR